jgi:hypothetical protein
MCTAGKPVPGYPKLLPDEVREVRRLHDAGIGCRSLSRMFEVGRTTIRSIVRGHRYVNVL